jgi:hypothetical protein
MVRIGGERIWERAVAAAGSMIIKSSAKACAEVEMATHFGKNNQIVRVSTM